MDPRCGRSYKLLAFVKVIHINVQSSYSFLLTLCGQLQNQSELRAYSAERAAFLLDTALAARSTNRSDCREEDRRNSHMLFTLHVSQCRMEKSSKTGSMIACLLFLCH